MPPLAQPVDPLYLGALRFAEARWFWWTLVALVLLVAGQILVAWVRRRQLARLGHVPQLARMAETVSPGRRALKAVLLCLAVLGVGLSMARPQLEGPSRWRQRGIDLVVVMDYSKSMLALDVRPSRLQRARVEINRLLDGLHGDRVGVVAFAGGNVHYPMTTDYDAVRLLVDGLQPSDLAPGSDLAGALAQARCLLRPDLEKDADCDRGRRRGHGGDPLSAQDLEKMRERQLETSELGERARAILLVTDGEVTTDGDVQAQAEKAAQWGIEVYVVGVGTPEGAPVPDIGADGQQRGWKTDENGQTVTSRLDEEGLRRLAAAAGEDHYLRLAPGQLGLEPITRALGRLKDGELESRVVKSYNEAYLFFLFPAFLCLVIEAVLGERRRRTS
jgi:Ca-activated chloride channel family protein